MWPFSLNFLSENLHPQPPPCQKFASTTSLMQIKTEPRKGVEKHWLKVVKGTLVWICLRLTHCVSMLIFSKNLTWKEIHPSQTYSREKAERVIFFEIDCTYFKVYSKTDISKTQDGKGSRGSNTFEWLFCQKNWSPK